jgi:hypothetical protein
MTQKVFCIGFPKTGTSSLASALATLGYNVCRRLPMLQSALPNVDLIGELKNKDYSKILAATKDFDAFCDNPWLLLYKEIEKQHPNCKFILTVREEKKWLKSTLQYFGNSTSEMREIIFEKPSPIGNEELYLIKYKQHNSEVKEYFKGKPSKLLVLDINGENKFEKLTIFLGMDKKSIPYPFENKTPQSTFIKRKKITFQRIINLINLPLRQKLLHLEAFTFITISRFLIVFIPFKKLANRIGNLNQESSLNISTEQQVIGLEIGKLIKKVSQFTPFRSLCFEQALTCKLMLNRRKISSTIYFGLLKKEKNDGKDLKAHAWLRSGENYLTGNKGKNHFTVVAKFGGKLNK